MGIFSRMTDIVNANLNAMLDKAEDPEKMVRLIIQEMEDTLVEVRSTSVCSIARKKELQRQIAQLQGDAADWQLKAERQIHDGRMDNAMLKFEQYEAKIDGLEAQLESYDLGQARTLKDQFAELERGEKLEAELDQLRSKLGKPKPPAA